MFFYAKADKKKSYAKNIGLLLKYLLAERGRFELPVAFDHTRFPIVLLRPARTPLRNVHAIYNIFILPASAKLRSEEFRIVPGKILARGAVHH